MKKCNSCGFSNDNDAQFCAGCGASLEDASVVDDQAAPAQDDPFADPAAAPADNAAANDQPQGQQEDAKPQKGFKGAVTSVKSKTVEFEKKHSIILNAIVLVCALVVIFVSLFAPIKVVNYQLILPEGSLGIVYEEANEDGSNYVAHYGTINQSIWQMIGALSYIGADQEALDALEEEMEKAFLDVEGKLDALEGKEENADYYNQKWEIYADCLSGVNILGYVLASNSVLIASDIDSDGFFASKAYSYDDDGYFDDDEFDAPDIKFGPMMTYAQAIMTLGFGLVVTVLAIVAAIVSLVYLIKAIIGMVKKQPQNKLFKYFGTILGISGAAVLLTMFGPFLATGGGMFAVAVFISIMYFLCGAVSSFVFGKDGLVLSIKRTAIALFGMIAFFILCTNIYALTNETEYFTATFNAPMGFGFHNLFSAITSLDGVTSNINEEAIGAVLNAAVPGVVGYATYMILVVAMCLAFRAYQRTLLVLAFGDRSKSFTGFAIAAVVFLILGLVASMAVANAFGGFVAGIVEDAAEFEINLDQYLTASIALRAQVWVSMIFFLIIAVVNLAFRPKSKNTEVAQGQVE